MRWVVTTRLLASSASPPCDGRTQGCAQEHFGITPDLTTMGKVIGGGLPVGAYGGRKDIMKMVAPAGPMYQAGTLSGNPLAMTAGIKVRV